MRLVNQKGTSGTRRTAYHHPRHNPKWSLLQRNWQVYTCMPADNFHSLHANKFKSKSKFNTCTNDHLNVNQRCCKHDKLDSQHDLLDCLDHSLSTAWSMPKSSNKRSAGRRPRTWVNTWCTLCSIRHPLFKTLNKDAVQATTCQYQVECDVFFFVFQLWLRWFSRLSGWLAHVCKSSKTGTPQVIKLIAGSRVSTTGNPAWVNTTCCTTAKLVKNEGWKEMGRLNQIDARFYMKVRERECHIYVRENARTCTGDFLSYDMSKRMPNHG